MSTLLNFSDTARVRRAKAIRRELDNARRQRTQALRISEEEKVKSYFQEGLENGVSPDDFSIRALFEELIPDGRELVRHMQSGPDWAHVCYRGRLGEADGIKMTDFSDFTRTVLSASVKDAYRNPVYLGDQLTTKVTSHHKSERIPGVSGFGDEAEAIGELQPIPIAGISADYVDTPETQKYGLGTMVSREAVFFDQTGLVLRRAKYVGKTLGLRKEKRILRTVLGIDNTWRPKDNHLSTDTYQPGGSGYAFDNTNTSNGLDDWTAIRTAEDSFQDITDPRTGEPIVIGGNRKFLVPMKLKWDLNRIIGADWIRVSTDSANQQAQTPNPVKAPQDAALSNEYVAIIQGDDTTWHYGAFDEAFLYIENWPITSIPVSVNSMSMAQHDAVMGIFSTEMGTPAVEEPRYVNKNVQ